MHGARQAGAEDDGIALARGRRPRVAIIGAGFSGIAAAYYLKRARLDDFLVFESAAEPGGTWSANRYPGCEVDLISHFYCLSFSRHDWPRRYGSQPELKAYLESTIDVFGLRPHFRFGMTAVSAVWNEAEKLYRLTFADGRSAEFEAVVSCVGFLSVPRIPNGVDIPAFPGLACHTAQWRDDISFEGKRVGVVGTGSSAVQVAVEAAKCAHSLTVFQRSPNWNLPKRNRAYTPAQRLRYMRPARFLYNYARAFLGYERVKMSGRLDQPGSRANRALHAVAETYLRQELAGRPDLVEKLLPDHPYAAKRPVASDGYYAALRQDNVKIAPGLKSLGADGAVDMEGRRHELDVVVLATGFHAASYLRRLEVVGRGGVELHDRWQGEPAAYLGACVPGFPNFFMLYGPNSNTGSLIFVLECQAKFAAGCLAGMARRRGSTVEVRRSAFDRFNARLQARLKTSVFTMARNYYTAPSGRVVTQWPFSALRFWWISRLARWSAMRIE